MNSVIKIGNKKIGKGFPTLIVAEISANHGKNLKTAKALIRKAGECKADAVKFQAYTPDTLTINAKNKYFIVKHPKWGGQTLYKLYEKAYTPWEWFEELKETAEKLGMLFFSTAYDKSSVDFLEKINVPVHKLASFEIIDLPLIAYVAQTGKPLILSTGMATMAEIKEAVDTARKNGAKDIVLLKCTSSYPAKAEEMNLSAIPDMAKRFGCHVGLSDHTLGFSVSATAVALGARIVEKHFTLSRKAKTPDSFFSTEPCEFKRLRETIRASEKTLGKTLYGLTSGEKKNKNFRRSLFAVRNIKKGEKFTEENVRSIRPGYGLQPRYLKDILGCSAKKCVKRGIPLKWSLIKEGKRD